MSGNQLIEAPRYTANVAADYSVPVNGWALNLHADATFVGSQFFLATNSPQSRIGPSQDVVAQIALRSPSGQYQVALYGKNLTDNKVSTAVAIDPTTQTKFTTVPYPRRFGIEVSAQF